MALEGTLRDISLEDLFDIFVTGQRSGRLLLAQGSEQGKITISRGRIADASLFAMPGRTLVASDTEAMIRMCLWDNANFIFVHDKALDNQPIHIRATFPEILKQAERQRALAHVTLQTTDLLRIENRPDIDDDKIELNREEWQLLSALFSERTVDDVSRDMGVPPSQALAVAKGLLDRGLLRNPLAEPARPAYATAPTPIWANRISPSNKKPESAPAGANNVLLRAIIRKVQNL